MVDKISNNWSITVRTSPSLAMIKYWGKSEGENIPATSSLALNLKGLYTETKVNLCTNTDKVIINNKQIGIERFTPFFDKIRKVFKTDIYFDIESTSNFPTSAGLASSSSGFAALAYGCAKLLNPNTNIKQISEFARLGSASASRAVFEGYATLRKESLHAEEIFSKTHWPELRVIIAIVKNDAKKISSRAAMEKARTTSPYYKQWIEESENTFNQAIQACKNKDLSALGPLIRKSYLMMFSTMFTSSPPVFYWEPDSIALIKACDELRLQKFEAWETMDAGPQVKIFALEHQCPSIVDKLKKQFPHINFLISQAGEGPVIIN
jgi:diphosphomevalonate decarboxylase